MQDTTRIILDLLTVGLIIFGTFFMLVAAVGLIKMPDVYHRMHAATKGVTLGISGLLLAALLYIPAHHEQISVVEIVTKLILVLMFQFIANPIGAHLLSKAAHMDGAKKWEGTLSDELENPTHRSTK